MKQQRLRRLGYLKRLRPVVGKAQQDRQRMRSTRATKKASFKCYTTEESVLAHASVAPRIFRCLDLLRTHLGNTQLMSLLWLEDCSGLHGVSALFRVPDPIFQEAGKVKRGRRRESRRKRRRKRRDEREMEGQERWVKYGKDRVLCDSASESVEVHRRTCLVAKRSGEAPHRHQSIQRQYRIRSSLQGTAPLERMRQGKAEFQPSGGFMGPRGGVE